MLLHKRLGHPALSIPEARRLSNAQVTAVTSSNEEEKVMLLHKRFGHPAFHLLETMYPHYFKNRSIDKIVCDACQFAKTRRKTYLLMNLRCHKPFSTYPL